MIDYIGVLITGFGALTFSIKDPWDRRLIRGFSIGHLGILFLIGGILVSVVTTKDSNIEKSEYKSQLKEIDDKTEKTLIATQKGIDTLLLGYNLRTSELLTSFSKNYDTLMAAIIKESDSTLKTQLNKVKSDYKKMNEELLKEKEINYRFDYSVNWPYTDKDNDQKIASALFFFISSQSGFLDGTDNYIIWYLIENEGYLSSEKYFQLIEEIRNNLKPFTLNLNISMLKLQKLEVLKVDLLNKTVEFTDEYHERLNVYKKHFGTDQYMPEMSKLDRKYFNPSDYKHSLPK